MSAISYVAAPQTLSHLKFKNPLLTRLITKIAIDQYYIINPLINYKFLCYFLTKQIKPATFNANTLFIPISKSKYYAISIVINLLYTLHVIVIALKCDLESYY